MKIPCKRNGRKYNLLLQVVDVKHGPLLSAQVCRKLGFVKFCDSVPASQPVDHDDLMEIHRIKVQDSGNGSRQKNERNRMQKKSVVVYKQPRKEPQTSEKLVQPATPNGGETPQLLKLVVTTEMPIRLKRNTMVEH